MSGCRLLDIPTFPLPPLYAPGSPRMKNRSPRLTTLTHLKKMRDVKEPRHYPSKGLGSLSVQLQWFISNLHLNQGDFISHYFINCKQCFKQCGKSFPTSISINNNNNNNNNNKLMHKKNTSKDCDRKTIIIIIIIIFNQETLSPG